MIKGPAMSDKSPRQTMTKKSGKSLKEKRAVKRDKAAVKLSSTETLFDHKKHWAALSPAPVRMDVCGPAYWSFLRLGAWTTLRRASCAK
jgi:hypothetical protein